MILLRIKTCYEEYLGYIRTWENLQIGRESDYYWIRGFTEQQLDSLELKSIPYKELFVERDSLLFPIGSSLPTSRLTGLIWSPIDRGLTVQIPDFNHNYFGLDSSIPIKIVSSEKEESPSILVVDLDVLRGQIGLISELRLNDMSWVVFDEENALIMGVPLLSISGDSYWIQGCSILPSGFNFEYPLLVDFISNKLNPNSDSWIFWQRDGSYALIKKDDFRSLSRSSVRLTRVLPLTH